MEFVVPFTVVPVVVPLAFLVSGFLGSFLKEELGDLTVFCNGFFHGGKV